MRERDCYCVLKLPPGASYQEIQSAYRRLVKVYHPDISGRATDGRRLARIVEAFRTLQDSKPGSTPRTTSHAGGGSELSLSDLGRLVVEGRSPSTRAFAVLRLGNSRRRSAYAWIRPALYDQSRAVVETAVDAIGTLGVLQSAGELAALYARSDGSARLRVLDAVRAMPDYRPFRSIILSGMQDGDGDVRRLGLQLFRRLKQTDGVEYSSRA